MCSVVVLRGATVKGFVIRDQRKRNPGKQRPETRTITGQCAPCCCFRELRGGCLYARACRRDAGVKMSVGATTEVQLGSGSTCCEAVTDTNECYEKQIGHRKMPGAQDISRYYTKHATIFFSPNDVPACPKLRYYRYGVLSSAVAETCFSMLVARRISSQDRADTWSRSISPIWPSSPSCAAVDRTWGRQRR